MTTSRDQQRIAAFREFIARVAGDADAAATLLGINRRKVGRMASTIAPPVTLLLDCAERALAAGHSKLARRLLNLAAPPPLDGGRDVDAVWIDEAGDIPAEAIAAALREARHA